MVKYANIHKSSFICIGLFEIQLKAQCFGLPLHLHKCDDQVTYCIWKCFSMSK